MDDASITVLTGAGISTGAGIPDFRGPDGVWTRFPEQARLLEIDAFTASRAVRVAGWRSWAEHPAWAVTPSTAHRSLLALESAGVLGAVLTQNFDGLHSSAGHSPGAVVELHGTLRTTSCLACGSRLPTLQVIARLSDEPDPRCAACGGILKPDIVYFGEALPAAALDRAVELAHTCEVFVAIGTTLGVQPVASLAGLAARAGARLVIVNRDPTPYDLLADDVIREPIETAVPELVASLLG